MPHILARGADWFRSMGTAESPGTIVATVVGDVVAPDVGEVELGTPLRAVIDAVGSGVTPGRTVKAVFSGVANAVVTAADLDAPVSYEGFAAVGSGMGSAGFIVYDDTACMVDAAYRFSRFLSIESCGQCPPCKLGSGEITERLERIETGAGDDDDLEAIGGWLRARHRRQPLLPRRRGAASWSAASCAPSRGVRRPHRAAPLPPPPATADAQAGRPRATAGPPTTRPSGASARTGPTTRRRRSGQGRAVTSIQDVTDGVITTGRRCDDGATRRVDL